MFPNLTSGIDSAGQKFVELGDDISASTEKLNENLKAQRDIANLKVAEELPKVMKGLIGENRTKDAEIDDKKAELQLLGDSLLSYN